MAAGLAERQREGLGGTCLSAKEWREGGKDGGLLGAPPYVPQQAGRKGSCGAGGDITLSPIRPPFKTSMLWNSFSDYVRGYYRMREAGNSRFTNCRLTPKRNLGNMFIN